MKFAKFLGAPFYRTLPLAAFVICLGSYLSKEARLIFVYNYCLELVIDWKTMLRVW